jgi:tetratricopeptide (TPR) repeat protein
VRRAGGVARLIPALSLGVALQGCVYFNAMYNAKHFAKAAERAERAGRTMEAGDRWRIAQLHADSVIVRHPRSHWTPEAYLIRGRASLALQDFGGAVVSLEQSLHGLSDAERRAEAQLYLGRANLGLHRYPEALVALDSALQSRDARLRSSAYLYRGRVHLATRQSADALEDMRATREPDALTERARAALALGDPTLTALYADSLAAAASFREALWLPLLDSLARAGLSSHASGLVDRLLARRDVGLGSRSRLALADGDRRLAAGDSAGAAARFQNVQRVAPDSAEGRAAELRLLRMDLRAAATLDALARVRERLARVMRLGGQPGVESRDILYQMEYLDTLLVARGPGDAFWFARGEILRDSLGAPLLAGATFAEMAARFPESPWTPKGLLAAIFMGHPAADSLRALLRERYPSSPYTAVASAGVDRPEQFTLLEDSLQGALRLLPARPGFGPPTAPDDVDRARQGPPAAAPRPGVRTVRTPTAEP